MIRRTTARALVGASTLLVALLFTGCVAASPPAATPAASRSAATPVPKFRSPESTAPPAVGTSATAVAEQLVIHAEPGGDVTQTLPNPQESGAPLTLLVVARRDGWLQVALAQRPNGTTGWVAAEAVTLHTLVYSLDVSTEQNTLTLSESGRAVKTYAAATGTGGTPTPHGAFYLTELLEPTNEGYGPYAFGLSAFSDVLSSFGGGPGQIGLHGTDDEASIGQSASHGCIRLSNVDITELAQILPLGTPVTVGP
ncbi:L,D-transpeptidase family protein [Microbacterium sp. CFBP 13617]|uniref:L,D-transpeptidase family protein n=1 Tax=Microbacterium sp. CFBP 13617 TaxID=2774035 RepID=UPI001783F8AA|nr:L,D-transpeptidase family protein [Microbacterium sp. CFBP 13617]